jgi:capsular exopolysaccharide synthesis family protein
VAVNLAAIFSQAKRSVALVDADLRHPNVHRYMGLPNLDGLSNLFRDQSDMTRVFRNRVDMPKLTVITTGPIPPNPAELLGSDRMNWILEELRSIAEMVIIDTPPSLVADAQVLAAKVDAVLLVVKPGKTSAEAARSSMELFRRAGARVVGVVLNRIPRNRPYYYGGYKYFSPYNDSKGYFTSAGVELEEAAPTDSSSD